jgi:hypothetical protein
VIEYFFILTVIYLAMVAADHIHSLKKKRKKISFFLFSLGRELCLRNGYNLFGCSENGEKKRINGGF